jgi:hypothetical protein
MSISKIKTGTFNAQYKISDIELAAVNRDFNEKHSLSFSKKLDKYGWLVPVIVSSKGDLIEGHHRVLSAQNMGQTTVPAYIVDWIDTDVENIHLDTIVNLNNANKAWSSLDYLKAYSKTNKHYKLVYDSYNENSEFLSVGNVINCFFNQGCNTKFKDGKCKVLNKKHGLYLVKELSNLVKKHGKRDFQPYARRVVAQASYRNAKMNLGATKHIIERVADMADGKDSRLNSITDLAPYLESVIRKYNKENK